MQVVILVWKYCLLPGKLSGEASWVGSGRREFITKKSKQTKKYIYWENWENKDFDIDIIYIYIYKSNLDAKINCALNKKWMSAMSSCPVNARNAYHNARVLSQLLNTIVSIFNCCTSSKVSLLTLQNTIRT